MRRIYSLLLASMLGVASLITSPGLAQDTERPATVRRGAPGRDLNRIFKSYERLRLDTAEAASQVRMTGRLLINTESQTLELELEPNDLRAENYRAEETLPGGARVPLVSSDDPIRTFKGRARGIWGVEEARFTIDEESFEGSILTSQERYYIEPARHYLPSADPSEFLFYKASDVIETEPVVCSGSLHEKVSEATDRLNESESITSPQPSDGTYTTQALTTPLEVQLATEADFEYVTALGGSVKANSEILSIMNQVEGVYQKEIGLSFSIVFQHTWATSTDPYTTVDPVLAIKEFTNYWNATFPNVARDMAHMWTGKNLTGTTGLGWTGVVCRSPASAYSLSERLITVPQKYILPAHEIGHNFNAAHTDGNAACANTIMQAIATDNSQISFCQVSRDQITAFINANSSCLSPAPTCTYSISPTSASFTSAGGTGSTGVTTAAGCAWTAKSNVTWITVTAGASGSGNGTVSYSVAANTATTARTGTITAAGKTFTVTQAAAAASCTYSISPTSASFTSAGGTGSTTVTTTAACARTAVSNVQWITITAGASGSGTGTVSYSVAANTLTTSRTGTITVAGKTFTVTQAAAPCAFSISPTSASFTSVGGTGSTRVTTTTGCAWTAKSNVTWLTITAGATGTGAGTVSYRVAANTATTARTGTITAAGKTFTVTQAAAPPTVSSLVLGPALVAGCKGVTGTVSINARAPVNGVVVTLTDTLASTTVPASVTIPAGATSKTFIITTVPVSTSQTGTVTARTGTVTRNAALTVRPIGVLTVSATLTVIVGGNTTAGKATLECPAAPGNITVTLADNLTATTLPASIIVPAGATSQTFQIGTAPVSVSQKGTLTATANGVGKNLAITVRPIGVLSLTLSPNPVTGGSEVTGTVALERPAAPGNIVVTLSSNNSGVAVPTVTSITIPAGARSQTFKLRTGHVTTTTSVIITVTANGISKSATLTVNPGG